jgi:hypothetical protein
LTSAFESRPELKAERDKRALERFFRREILQLGERKGWSSSPMVGDSTLHIYYLARGEARLRPSDFELAFDNPADVGRTLDDYWRTGPLAGLGARLARLMPRFRERDEKKDVSSFVYEMF